MGGEFGTFGFSLLRGAYWHFLCRGVHIVAVLFGVGWWVLYLCGAVVLMVNLVVMNNHIGLWRLKFLGLVIIGLILG